MIFSLLVNRASAVVTRARKVGDLEGVEIIRRHASRHVGHPASRSGRQEDFLRALFFFVLFVSFVVSYVFVSFLV